MLITVKLTWQKISFDRLSERTEIFTPRTLSTLIPLASLRKMYTNCYE